MYFNKIFITIIAIHFILIVNAQTPITDTVEKKMHKADIFNKSWNVNLQLGEQRRSFIGAGISKSMFKGSPHGIYGYDIYATAIYYPKWKTNYESVYGIKFGGNTAGNAITLGTDFQLLKTNTKNDFLFTPRIGIGISSIYINYGYSFSQNDYPIFGISKSSITFNINLPFYTNDIIKKK